MSDMIERGAMAILAKVPLGYGMTTMEAFEYSRAANAATRIPTDMMIEAGKIQLQSISGFEAEKKLTAIWGAMHAAMMAEKQ